MNPASKNTSTDHGVMVEVLVDGQFGYYGTHNLSYESVKHAAKLAYAQAKNAANLVFVHFLKKFGLNQLVNIFLLVKLKISHYLI